jgi:hypothetical protein
LIIWENNIDVINDLNIKKWDEINDQVSSSSSNDKNNVHINNDNNCKDSNECNDNTDSRKYEGDINNGNYDTNKPIPNPIQSNSNGTYDNGSSSKNRGPNPHPNGGPNPSPDPHSSSIHSGKGAESLHTLH